MPRVGGQSVQRREHFELGRIEVQGRVAEVVAQMMQHVQAEGQVEVFGAGLGKAVVAGPHLQATPQAQGLGGQRDEACVFGGGARGMGLVVQLLLWTPLSAAITALVAILLLTIFRPLFRPGS